MTDVGIWGWVLFNLAVLAMLAFDLGVVNRKAHEISLREATVWSIIWIVLALLFNGWIFYRFGSERAQEFLAGYLIEKSLSVDNIFVFYVIFSYFGVEPKYRHRVLFWGILGAPRFMRGAMIAAGLYLISRFHWIILVFGVFLIITGIRMLFHKEEKTDIEKIWVVRLARRFIPMTPHWHGQCFFVKEAGKWLATPMLLVVLVVEATDLVFALDSIPAYLRGDPRSLYRLHIERFRNPRLALSLLPDCRPDPLFLYLKYALSFILVFVGVKMLLADTAWKIPTNVSLLVIATSLALAIAASALVRKPKSPELE